MTDAKGFTAIDIHSAYTVKLEDVAITYAGGDGIKISDSTNIVFYNVRVEGLGQGIGTGIVLNHSEVKIFNIDVEGFLHGMRVIQTGGGVHVFGGYMERNGGYGILFEQSSYNSIDGLSINSPNNGGIAIGFWGGKDMPSQQNIIIGSKLSIGNSVPGTLVYQDIHSKDNTLINTYLNNGTILRVGENNLTVLNEGAQFGKIQIGGGDVITRHISSTSFLDFNEPMIVPESMDQTILVPGAEMGDTVGVGSPVPVGKNFILTAFVQEPGKITVRWTQIGGQPEDPDKKGGVYRVDIWKHEKLFGKPFP